MDLDRIKYQTCPYDDEEGVLLTDLEEAFPETDEDGELQYYCLAGQHMFGLAEDEVDELEVPYTPPSRMRPRTQHEGRDTSARTAKAAEETQDKANNSPFVPTVSHSFAETTSNVNSEPQPVRAILDQLGLHSNPHLESKSGRVKGLYHRQWQRRAEAARLLGEQGEIVDLVGLIVTALYDPVEAVRAAAVRALGKVGKEAGVEALTSAVSHDSSWIVRAAAIEALGEYPHQAPVPLLTRMALEDKRADVRSAAVVALGRLGESIPVEQLVEVLRDPDWQVREATVLVLGKLRDLAPEQQLVEALQDEDEMVRIAAKQALENMHQQEA